MDIAIEPVTQAWPDCDKLLHDYFERTIAKEGLPPLRMNWLGYVNLDNSGHLILITARGKDHELLGFVMYHIHDHLHHMGVTNAACDIIAVSVDYRSGGIARRMMKYAEPVLKARGVRYITHQFRTGYKAEPLFPKLGYRLIEQAFVKEID